MSLKSRLLNKNIKLKKEKVGNGVVSSANIDILSYFDNNPDLSSLLLYGHDKIFAEKNGVLNEIDLALQDNEAFISVIENIANQYDRIINFQNPSYTIVLSSGVKISAMLPPLVKAGGFLSIKRQPKCSKNFDGIIEDKITSNEVLLFLKECLNIKLNIFVTAQAQVNKANILNFLANKTSSDENIITIESLPQLKIKRENSLGLIKQKGNFSKILRKAINLGHERIVISEASISEMVSVFEYVNVGYNGFLTSFSSKSYEEMLFSMQNLIMLSFPNLNEQNANALIYSSVDIVVFVSKTKDGKERITSVSELVKTKTGLKLQDIFVWKESKSKTDKFNGYHQSTGVVSRFFPDNSFLSLGFLEEYFNKEYKHNYIGKNVDDNAQNKLKAKKKSNLEQSKLNKYKALKEKIKSHSK